MPDLKFEKQTPFKMENEELNMILTRMQDPDVDIQNNALKMQFDITKSSHSKSIDTINFQYLVDKLPLLEEACSRLEEEMAV